MLAPLVCYGLASTVVKPQIKYEKFSDSAWYSLVQYWNDPPLQKDHCFCDESLVIFPEELDSWESFKSALKRIIQWWKEKLSYYPSTAATGDNVRAFFIEKLCSAATFRSAIADITYKMEETWKDHSTHYQAGGPDLSKMTPNKRAKYAKKQQLRSSKKKLSDE